MTVKPRIIISSDHADIALRQDIARHVAERGFEVEDIGPATAESTDYPKHGEAAARRISRAWAALVGARSTFWAEAPD